ncbi:cytochrome p450 [Ophiostoma piceae UAMH 11346]|uniref:Cytochrome p450 n=1 Tax=Ophiostoma piceae (strain UAMH 11346) TaxID=1262450 RepID=S3BV00_OPHP1|nr:cytochrome p450 [Ophiostoma piceae UAMH 11346]
MPLHPESHTHTLRPESAPTHLQPQLHPLQTMSLCFSTPSSSVALCLTTTIANATIDTLSALASQLTVGRALLSVSSFLLAAFLVDCALKPRYPRSLPRVGYGDSVLATMRNWLGYVFYFNDWVEQGYKQFSKQNKAFVVPSAASRPQEIVVPRSQTAWMLDLPDSVLSAHAAHDDMLYTAYNFIFDIRGHARRHAQQHPHLYQGRAPPPTPDLEFHTRVMHRNLARHLPELLPAIEDEVAVAVDAAFGSAADAGADVDDEGWCSINLWDAWLAMVPPITNLLLVGPEACRNDSMLKAFIQFADSVVTNSFLLNMVPKLLHPIAGRLASIPNRRLWRRAHRELEPLVKERLRLLTTKQGRTSKAPVNEDFLTWHIRMALAEGRMSELDPEAITKRLLPIEFAAIHTTVLTGFFVVLDLLTSDPERDYISGIREEVATVRASCDAWSKPTLARLWRTDSAIRESQRVSHFATSLSKRKVVTPGGVTNTAEGWHVPYGSLLMLNLANTHHDPDLYSDPDTYDAFRYARQREAYEAEADAVDPDKSTATGSEKAAEAMRGLKLGMVTTSDQHLAFGHGRHACPGRFFVAHELKMIIAYLFANYDIKPLDEKPKSLWIGQTIIPPISAKVQVRRRKL